MTVYNKGLAAGLIAATIVAAIIGALAVSFPKYYRLSSIGVETKGTVIAKERENHQSIVVEYRAGDRLFKTTGRAQDVNKSFETVDLKEKVSVFYDPAAPESSTLGDPNNQLESCYTFIFLIGLTPLIFFVAHKLKKKSSKPTTPNH